MCWNSAQDYECSDFLHSVLSLRVHWLRNVGIVHLLTLWVMMFILMFCIGTGFMAISETLVVLD